MLMLDIDRLPPVNTLTRDWTLDFLVYGTMLQSAEPPARAPLASQRPRVELCPPAGCNDVWTALSQRRVMPALGAQTQGTFSPVTFPSGCSGPT